MRFAYSPDTGCLSVYATPEEFHLTADVFTKNPASGEKEFRVIVKHFKNKDRTKNEAAIMQFLEEYNKKLIIPLMGDLYPDEKIKDIVVLSTMSKLGFSWTSLTDIDNFNSSQNFFDMVLSYAVKAITSSDTDKKSGEGRELMELLSEDDFAKLTLAKVILSSINHPTVWKKKHQTDRAKDQLEVQMAGIDKKLQRLEKKDGFLSAQAVEFYQNDQFPEDDIALWLQLIQQASTIRLALEKYGLVEELVGKWRDSFTE